MDRFLDDLTASDYVLSITGLDVLERVDAEVLIRFSKEERANRRELGDLSLARHNHFQLDLIDSHLDRYRVAKEEFELEAVRPYQPRLGLNTLLGMLPGG